MLTTTAPAPVSCTLEPGAYRSSVYVELVASCREFPEAVFAETIVYLEAVDFRYNDHPFRAIVEHVLDTENDPPEEVSIKRVYILTERGYSLWPAHKTHEMAGAIWTAYDEQHEEDDDGA